MLHVKKHAVHGKQNTIPEQQRIKKMSHLCDAVIFFYTYPSFNTHACSK